MIDSHNNVATVPYNLQNNRLKDGKSIFNTFCASNHVNVFITLCILLSFDILFMIRHLLF